ncbi:hypothetical protein [Actinomyces radicidentis]|uniref:hypothetical protein n=1 Tax=Actinomyces radicidentis TaxID=111015 RepID=UPI0026E1118A|nr:hypothetical protein [Actinomyces radicidentis]
MNHDDLAELLEEALTLPLGPERSARLAQVSDAAVAAGDERLDVRARVLLLHAYLWGGEDWKALAPFAWCLARLEERPDLFDQPEIDHLRWCYKSALEVVARNPGVPLEQVRELEAAMEAFYRSQGASMHSVHGTLFNVERSLGRPDLAAAQLAAWRATPPDESSDCAACDPEHEVLQALSEHDDARALAVGVPVLRAGAGCDEQPASMQSMLLLPLLRSGRHQQAWSAHVRAYRKHAHSLEHVANVGWHLSYLALSGHLDRGLRLLRHHAPWTARSDSAAALVDLLTGMTLVLREAVREGRGDEPLEVELPENTLWAPGWSVEGPATLAQAAARTEDWARALTARFDARNGNRVRTELLEESLAMPPVDRAGDGAAEGGGAPAEAPGGAPRGERVELLETAAPEEPAPRPAGLRSRLSGWLPGRQGGPSDAPSANSSAAPSSGASAGAGRAVEPAFVPPADLTEALDRLTATLGVAGDLIERSRLLDWFHLHGVLTTEPPQGRQVAAAEARARLLGDMQDAPRAFEAWRTLRRLLDQDDAERSALAGAAPRARLLEVDIAMEAAAPGPEDPEEERAATDRAASLRARARSLAQEVLDAPAGPEQSEDLVAVAGACLTGTGTALSPQAAAEGEELLAVAQALVERLERLDADPHGHVRTQLELSRSALAHVQGDVYGAARTTAEALEAATSLSASSVVSCRHRLAWLSVMSGQLDEAVAQDVEAANLLLAAGADCWAVSVMEPLANVLGGSGRALEAAEVLETAIDLAQSASRPDRVTRLQGVLVLVLEDLGEHERLLEVAAPLLEEAEEQGDEDTALGLLQRSASAAEALQRPDQACDLLRRAAGYFPAEEGAPAHLLLARARLLRRAALALTARPTPGAARRHRDQALAMLDEAREVVARVPDQEGFSGALELAETDLDLASVEWVCDEPHSGVEAAERALAGFTAVGDRHSAVRARATLARFHVSRLDEPGEREAAEREVAAGRALLAEVRDADPALSGWFDEVEEYLRRQG